MIYDLQLIHKQQVGKRKQSQCLKICKEKLEADITFPISQVWRVYNCLYDLSVLIPQLSVHQSADSRPCPVPRITVSKTVRNCPYNCLNTEITVRTTVMKLCPVCTASYAGDRHSTAQLYSTARVAK